MISHQEPYALKPPQKIRSRVYKGNVAEPSVPLSTEILGQDSRPEEILTNHDLVAWNDDELHLGGRPFVKNPAFSGEDVKTITFKWVVCSRMLGSGVANKALRRLSYSYMSAGIKFRNAPYPELMGVVQITL